MISFFLTNSIFRKLSFAAIAISGGALVILFAVSYLENRAVEKARAQWNAQLFKKTSEIRQQILVQANKEWENVLIREKQDRVALEALNETLRSELDAAALPAINFKDEIDEWLSNSKIPPCKHNDTNAILDGLPDD